MVQNHVPIFKIGDLVLVGHKEEKVRAQIVSFRVRGNSDYGCDVITEEGEVKFHSLQMLCAWNPNKVRSWFK